MPPFQYVPFDPSALVPNIAALIARQGDPAAEAARNIAAVNARAIDSTAQGRAEAARASGDIWGRTLAQIGQIPGQVIAQSRAAADDAQRRALVGTEITRNTLANTATQEQQAGLAMLPGLITKYTDPTTGTVTPEGHASIAHELDAAGHPGAAEKWLKHSADSATDIDTVRTADAQPKIARAVAVAKAAQAATDPGDFQARLGQLVIGGALDPQHAQEIAGLAAQAGPDGWPALKKQYVDTGDQLTPHLTVKKDEKIAQGVSATTILDNADPNEGAYTINGQRFRRDGTPLGAAVPKQAEPAKLGSPEDFLASYAKEKFNIAPEAMTIAQKGEALGAFKSANADQEMRDAALAQKNIAQALAQMQLNQVPTPAQAAAVADDLVNHRMSPSQMNATFHTMGPAGMAFKLAVTSEAKKIDPGFNFEQADAEYALSKSTGFQNTVRYMDSALESIPRLEQNAKMLGNGSFRTLNQLANAARDQFNSTDLKRFKTDALLVGDEIAKILSGGGTGNATSDAKLKQATDIIGQSDSVPAIAAAMDEVRALVGNRRRALTRGTYMEGLNAAPDTTPSIGAARIGERRLIDGKLGEWDGKGWKAVPQ